MNFLRSICNKSCLSSDECRDRPGRLAETLQRKEIQIAVIDMNSELSGSNLISCETILFLDKLPSHVQELLTRRKIDAMWNPNDLMPNVPLPLCNFPDCVQLPERSSQHFEDDIIQGFLSNFLKLFIFFNLFFRFCVLVSFVSFFVFVYFFTSNRSMFSHRTNKLRFSLLAYLKR